MAIHCFILGNNPILSLAEIFSLANGSGVDFKIHDLTRQILIVEFSKNQNLESWQNKLGGTIKIGRIIEKFTDLQAIADVISVSYLTNKIITRKEKKIVFGFSVFGNVPKKFNSKINKLGIKLKKGLQNKNLKSRYLSNDDGSLTSVQITKNKILERGADILIISGLHSFYLGRTETVQGFEDYSRRDFGRPQRDARSGMLPPKLAKIMINLTKIKSSDHLLDPFCGSGTILQEAILLGIKKMTGSDISRQAIDNTKRNLNWLHQEYQLKNTQFNLLNYDVKQLPNNVKPASIDCVVTEPYLGPPQTKKLSEKGLELIINELKLLYLDAFNSFAKIVIPGGKIVIVFPLFRLKNSVYTLRILETLQEQGFHRINPIPEKISLFAKIGPTARGSLIYRREDQRVEREILVFEYKKAEASK